MFVRYNVCATCQVPHGQPGCQHGWSGVIYCASCGAGAESMTKIEGSTFCWGCVRQFARVLLGGGHAYGPR